MNKKGFTLIELLVVIAIIGIVALLIYFSYFGSVDIVKDKLNDVQKSGIIEAAKSYTSEFRNSSDWKENISGDGKRSFCISINSLINKGYYKNNDKYVVENKDRLLVSVVIDEKGVFEYKIINNKDDDVLKHCAYSDVVSGIDNGSGSVDIKDDDNEDIGRVIYDVDNDLVPWFRFKYVKGVAVN